MFWLVNLYSLLVYIEHNGDESSKDLVVCFNNSNHNQCFIITEISHNTEWSEKHCIASSNFTYLVTWRWPKTEAETCRELELKNNKTKLCCDLLKNTHSFCIYKKTTKPSCVVTYLKTHTPFVYIKTTGMAHLKMQDVAVAQTIMNLRALERQECISNAIIWMAGVLHLYSQNLGA